MVITGDDVETARFFPDVRLNYAEASAASGDDDDRVALTACVPAGRPSASRAELRAAGAADRDLAGRPRSARGEQIVLIAPNRPGSVVAALAAAALGAAVSTATPDMGAAALLGRF